MINHRPINQTIKISQTHQNSPLLPASHKQFRFSQSKPANLCTSGFDLCVLLVPNSDLLTLPLRILVSMLIVLMTRSTRDRHEVDDQFETFSFANHYVTIGCYYERSLLVYGDNKTLSLLLDEIADIANRVIVEGVISTRIASVFALESRVSWRIGTRGCRPRIVSVATPALPALPAHVTSLIRLCDDDDD